MRHLLGRLTRRTSVMLLVGVGFIGAGIQAANAQCNPSALYVFEDSYASCSLMTQYGGNCYYECTWKSLIPDTTLAPVR